MPRNVSKYVVCPKCQQQTLTEIVISGNTVDDTSLRKMIFSEDIFRWKCKKCGFSSKYQHPLLYNDIRGKFMVYYIPQVERLRVVDAKLENEFPELSDIKRRVVPDINAMKEKITVLESGINDMALELTKLAVSEIVSKETNHTVYSGYFTDMNEEENTISFQFFVGGDKRSYIQSTRLEVYRHSLEMVRKKFAREERQQGFLNIGKQWAKNALDTYRGSR